MEISRPEKLRRIIGFAGFARVGKDSSVIEAQKHLGGIQVQRAAFADELKVDIQPLLQKIGCDLKVPDQKERARPLMVEWGKTARRFDPDYWVHRMLRDVARRGCEHVAVTDVRYANEVAVVKSLGGEVIRVKRPGYGPANDEEAESFAILDAAYPDLPVLHNSGPLPELGATAASLIRSLWDFDQEMGR